MRPSAFNEAMDVCFKLMASIIRWLLQSLPNDNRWHTLIYSTKKAHQKLFSLCLGVGEFRLTFEIHVLKDSEL